MTFHGAPHTVDASRGGRRESAVTDPRATTQSSTLAPVPGDGNASIAPVPADNAGGRDDNERGGAQSSPVTQPSPGAVTHAPGGGNTGTPSTPVAPPAGGGGTPANSTVTQIEVVRDDGGLAVSRSSMTTGPIDVTYRDARSGVTSTLTVSQVGFALHNAEHAQGLVNGVGKLVLVSTDEGGGDDSTASALVDVSAPTQAAPSEPTEIVTIDLIAGGVQLPYRQLGTNAPYVAGVGAPSGLPWTTIDGGAVTIRVRNPQHLEREIHIDGFNSHWRVRPSQDEISFGFTLNPRADRTYVVRAENGDGPVAGEALALWLR
jgi:hypothetical protein